MASEASDAIRDGFISFTEKDSKGNDGANVVDGLYAIAEALDGLYAIAEALESVASALHRLGNADAATPMGALEAFGLVMQEGLGRIASAIVEAGEER